MNMLEKVIDVFTSPLRYLDAGGAGAGAAERGAGSGGPALTRPL